MPDREKVIALLERYMRIPNLAGAENYGAKIVDMPAPLITDAIALLQAQEPMVITMEEAAQADYCYVEYKSGDVEPVLVNSCCDGNYRLQRKDAYHVVGPDTFAPYGRFWTSRPTDEQREAEPWE